jgi:hypothetical protein
LERTGSPPETAHPGDLVKAEIREALAHDKLVIPALVEGASLPQAVGLPPDMAELAGRNAIEIIDSRFAYVTERLIRAVQAHTDGPQDPRSRAAKQRRSWAWVSDPVAKTGGSSRRTTVELRLHAHGIEALALELRPTMPEEIAA